MEEPIPDQHVRGPAAQVRRFVGMLADSLACGSERRNESELAATVERLGLEFAQLGPRCIGPLERLLKASAGVEQAITAGLVVGAAEAGVGLAFSLDAVRSARETLVRALGNASATERFAAAYFLAQIGAWDEAKARLVAVLEMDEERTRVCAATALLKLPAFREQYPDAVLRAQAVLLRAIRSDDPFLRSIAAGGLANDPRARSAVAHLAAALGSATPLKKRNIITELAEQGEKAAVAAADLAKVVADEREPPDLRGHAAYALARVVGEDDGPGEKMIRAALESLVPEVVQGVFQGMHMRGQVPRWAYDAIADALLDEDNDTRWSAIKAIASGGEEVAAFFAPTLLDRAGMESDIALVDALAEVLAAAKEHAFPLLVRVIEEENLSKTAAFALALIRIGSDAAMALVDQVIEKAPGQSANLLPRVFMNMGQYAAPFVPAMCLWLDDESIDDTEDIQRTLYDLGDRAVLAIPALVRHVARRPSDMTRYARAALHAFGGLATAEIERATDAPDVDAQQRLRILLRDAAPHPASPSRMEAEFAEFLELDRDTLRLFVWMADELEGGELSFPELSARLMAKQGGGEIPNRFKTSRKALNDRMKKAARMLGVTLTTHRHGRKGGLTKEGVNCHRKLRRFLAWCAARR